MSTFLLVYYIFILILMVLFLTYMIHALATSNKGVNPPWVPATGEAQKIIFDRVSDILKKAKKPLTVLDPGSGTGSLLLPLAKKFPQHKFVGIEWSWPHYFAKFFARKLDNITLVHKDLFKYSFKEADVILCFVVPRFAPSLSKKIIKDVKKGCLIFSIHVELPGLEQIETIEYKHFGYVSCTINVYKVK